jgi:hypothetical protein
MTFIRHPRRGGGVGGTTGSAGGLQAAPGPVPVTDDALTGARGQTGSRTVLHSDFAASHLYISPPS